MYRNGVLEREGFPIADVSEHVTDPANTIWFDLCSPTPEELGAIGDELGLHEPAVEDVLSDHQRPKVDMYDNHLFISVYGAHVEAGRLDPVEVNVFLLHGLLDHVVDGQYELVEQLDGQAEELEESLFAEESIREMLADVRETRLAQQGFRLNEIMKRVTSWAAVIAVPTMITGFYGQNVPYPGSGETWGFWTSSVLVAVVSVALYAAFKKRDWL
ncbi:hypothetical protein HII36_10010 [Nonomuraea sp. NN258]|nr:hypothetical protein [Nonomuraea antri]